MSDFTYFSCRAPESVVVTDIPVLLATRTSSELYTVLYISNNSDNPIYLGFTGPRAEVGNAEPGHGITVFPKTVMAFDDPVPNGCRIWAVCDSGKTAIVGVQQ